MGFIKSLLKGTKWWKKRNWDRIVLLRKYKNGKILRKIGETFIDPKEKQKIRVDGKKGSKEIKIPKEGQYLNSNGNFDHFIDLDSGEPLSFEQTENDVNWSTEDTDAFLSRGLVSNFVESFGSALKRDKALMATLFGSGISAGIVFGFLLIRYIL